MMTKKITISVSDELHEKMMKWKDSFNFSKVFQDAISGLIQKKEDFQKRLKGDETMPEIIERLKREKAEAENQWFDTGKNDGIDFAKSTSYEELRHALDYEPVKELLERENVVSYDPSHDDILGDYFGDMCEEYSFGFPNNFFIEWESGWKEGVEEFWKEVKNKI